jgi:hypothetical protein
LIISDAASMQVLMIAPFRLIVAISAGDFR